MDLAETVMALALLYALLSVVASALKEALEAWVQKRKQNYKAAIEELLGFAGAQQFFEHPRIQAMISKVGLADATKSRHWPSYVDAATFALVAYDIVMTQPNSKLAKSLDWARGKGQQELDHLQTLYAQRMDRLSGSFKRNAQAWLMGIGLLLAVGVDADTLQMGRQLANDSAVRATLVSLAESTKDAAGVQALCGQSGPTEVLRCVEQKSPAVLGWTGDRWDRLQHGPWFTWLFKLVGYAITGIAISLGASFWFDLIGKVANIRATAKPGAL
jgi:hypothetical protein